MYPEVIKKSLDFLRIMTDNNVDDIALLNILNAKFCNMITNKGVCFKQYNNDKDVKQLSYYAINFMHSGRQKDYTVNCINNYLLNFIGNYCENSIENYKNELSEELELKKVKQEKINEALERVRPFNLEIYEANMTGLYAEAEQISNIGFGSLFIRIGELGDYIDGITSGNQDKKEFFQNLKNIYEGTIAGKIIKSEHRQQINNIPVQSIMYTDFSSLLDEKNNKYFKTMLKTGFSRRSFIYIPFEDNIKLNYPIKHSEKEDCIYKANELSNYIESEIFNKIQDKAILIYSEEAQELIHYYKCKCIDIVNSKKDTDSIVSTDLKESFWKIQKLACVYSLLGNPKSSIISSKYIQMAINFYEKIAPCLQVVVDKKEDSPEQRLKDYFISNVGKIISRSDIKNEKFVNANHFKKWFEDYIEEAQADLREQGIFVENIECKGNTKKLQIFKKEVK